MTKYNCYDKIYDNMDDNISIMQLCFTEAIKMQFVMDCLSVNSKGNLAIGGCDLLDIAKEFKTPAYVMDEEKIRNNCRAYTNSIKEYYDGNGIALYASKALSCKYIYKIAMEENMGVDVVSGGELYTALAAGFPADKIYFHGNNKTDDELEYAVKSGVGRIIVDNRFELDRLNTIAKNIGVCQDIMFRIKPGVDAHTHSFIQTGQIDSKFGAALETGEADEITGYAITLENVNVVGFHCHIGSQIFELEPFELAAKIMMNFIGDMRDKYGLEVKELNLGGGFGIKYVETDTPIDYGEYMRAVSEVVKDCAKERNLKLPFIVVEPGRSIVADAGLTLYTVGYVKEIPDVRTYVAVDGGMADNPRYILYGAKYSAVVAKNPLAEDKKPVTIAGKCCESGDLIGENMPLCDVKPGEILAILSTGAYNYSMSSNYNRIPRPPVIMIKDGKPVVAVRRETYEDIIRNDM